MKKRFISSLLAVLLLLGCLPAAAAGYSDVPSAHWAAESIQKATDLGIIQGIGGGKFGLGRTVTRAEFATMLVRLFGWTPVSPAKPSFTDNSDPAAWYYTAVETAAAHGAVPADSKTFRPRDRITREEMAVMLVRSLGYAQLASGVSDTGLPFQDVTGSGGYIAIAYQFGIINGASKTTFLPAGIATREQAAAMMIRLAEKYRSKIGWLHAFYAISSYSQADKISELDAVSFGWSRLQVSTDGVVTLNTTSSGGNEFCFPSGYQTVTGLARSSGVPANLSVYMSTAQTVPASNGTISNACREILTNADRRSAAAAQIVAQLKANPDFAGVTIDFEGMSGSDLKAGFTAFLKQLRAATDQLSKSVYVCVHPATADGAYYNAYDYRAIGSSCDRVILMAHDYEAKSLSASLMRAGYTATPLTPIGSVYYALKAITDPNTGVEDKSKVALAVSFNTAQWALQDGSVINSTPYRPGTSSIYARLTDSGTAMHYSDLYQNPYLTFYDGSAKTQNVVWYEDERSIAAKVDLARMFGVTGVSVWRLGLIPDYAGAAGKEIYYNVWNGLTARHS